jgi:hypothetical protein
MKSKIIGIIWGFLLFLAMGMTQNENETIANTATFFFGSSAMFLAAGCLYAAINWRKLFQIILLLFVAFPAFTQTQQDYQNLLNNYIQLQQECSPAAYNQGNTMVLQPEAKGVKSPCTPQKFPTTYTSYTYDLVDTVVAEISRYYLRIGSVDQSNRLGGYPPNTFRTTHFLSYASARGYEMALYGGWKTYQEAMTNKMWLESIGYCDIKVYHYYKQVMVPFNVARVSGFYTEKRE